MTNLVKVESNPYLVKDTQNGGVINTDKLAYENYKSRRAHALKEVNEKHAMQDKINSLTTELDEIKTLLSELIQQKSSQNG